MADVASADDYSPLVVHIRRCIVDAASRLRAAQHRTTRAERRIGTAANRALFAGHRLQNIQFWAPAVEWWALFPASQS
jgi:hypothetical protein